jgi:hypothetical protein
MKLVRFLQPLFLESQSVVLATGPFTPATSYSPHATPFLCLLTPLRGKFSLATRLWSLALGNVATKTLKIHKKSVESLKLLLPDTRHQLLATFLCVFSRFFAAKFLSVVSRKPISPFAKPNPPAVPPSKLP